MDEACKWFVNGRVANDKHTSRLNSKDFKHIYRIDNKYINRMTKAKWITKKIHGMLRLMYKTITPKDIIRIIWRIIC